MSVLFPQLNIHAAYRIARAVQSLPVDAIASEWAGTSHETAVYTEVGGARVSEAQLATLRTALVQAAREFGYPAAAAEQQRSWFDVASAVTLHQKMRVTLGEAAKAGIWNFVSCVLAPDLVRWRFPGAEEGTTIERFISGRRNVFQRLWWRAEVLRDDRQPNPYEVLARLGEDEVVQIMERPQLASCRQLAKTVGHQLVSWSTNHADIPRRYLIREIQKRLMRLSGFIKFELLDDQQLTEIVDGEFRATVGAFRR